MGTRITSAIDKLSYQKNIYIKRRKEDMLWTTDVIKQTKEATHSRMQGIEEK